MRLDDLKAANERAREQRPHTQPHYAFRHVSAHDPALHELKRDYPFFGYIDVEMTGMRSFVMFSNNDDLIAQTYFWYGPDSYETLSMQVWRRLSGQGAYVLDVGAFTGLYGITTALTNPAARVYCFEPIRRVFGRLLNNLAVNKLGQRITAVNAAAGEHDGHVDMNIFYGQLTLPAGSSMLPKRRETQSQERVEALRLDTFVEREQLPRVDLVKIDVEQAEPQVIAGMAQTITRDRPHLLVEVACRAALEAVAAQLAPHGYNYAVINDDDQTVAVNDPGAVDEQWPNVLFSAVAPQRLPGLCRPLDAFAERRGAQHQLQRVP